MMNNSPDSDADRNWNSNERLENLKQKVAAGLAEIDRGEFIELNGDDELHTFFERIKREGRERLEKASEQCD